MAPSPSRLSSHILLFDLKALQLVTAILCHEQQKKSRLTHNQIIIITAHEPNFTKNESTMAAGPLGGTPWIEDPKDLRDVGRRWFFSVDGEFLKKSEREILLKIENLHPVLMTLPYNKGLPPEFTDNVIHLIDSYGKLRMESADLVALIIQKNTEIATLLQELDESARKYTVLELKSRDEIKCLEDYIVNESGKGAEGLDQARSKIDKNIGK
jgi:hypothetical protein